MAKRKAAAKKKSTGKVSVKGAGYSGTPLVKKLGIKPDSILTLLNAPSDFMQTLGELPEKVVIKTSARGKRDLTIWFPKNAPDLKRRIEKLADAVGEGGLWIAWPKKASGVKTDLSDGLVRSSGLANGIVDYKVCAIDETYSGLKFATRKKGLS